MNLPEFLTEHANNGTFSPPDDDFLSEISKKSTKYLVFYDNECKKSDFLRSNLPNSSRIIEMDLSKDWVHEIFNIFDISRVPSTAVVKNGSMKPDNILDFNQTLNFFKTL